MKKPSHSFWVQWSIDRPVTVRMFVLAVLVVGAIAYLRIPLQLYPSGFTPRFLWVNVPYRSSSPAEVEKRIAQPVEEVLGTVAEIERLASTSSERGAGFRIRFAGGTDMDAAYVQVVDRMERVLPRLPDDAQRYGVFKFDPEDLPILWIAIGADSQGGAMDVLVQKAPDIEQHVMRRLERIPGVARVEGGGLSHRRYEIAFDLQALRRYRLDLYSLLQRLERENSDLSLGRVTRSGQHHFVRSVGRFQSIEEVKRLPVAPGVPLEAVARVQLGNVLEKNLARVDGFPATTFAVHKEGEANTVETAAEVRRVIEEELEDHRDLEGLRFLVLWDQGTMIRNSMGQLQETAALGGFLAVLVLFLFLRRVGMTGVIAFAIPFSLVVTLIVLYFQGESLNMISLMGLTLGVGMLVDNSVVVAESIVRVRASSGIDSRRAALQGTIEVALAVIIATSTTLVVFVPLMLMNQGHQFRFFMMRLGLPICYALLASLFTALVVIPFAASRLRPPGGQATRRAGRLRLLSMRMDARADALMKGLTDLYARGLSWVLSHRMDAFLLLVIPPLVLMVWLSGKLERTDENQSESRDFHLSVRFPDSYDLSDASHVMHVVEEALLEPGAKQELEIDRIFCEFDERRGRLWVFLIPPEESRRERSQIVKSVQEKLPPLKGLDFQVGWRARGGGEQETIPIQIQGPDTQRLADLAREVAGSLEGLPGLVGVETDLESGYDEIHVRIDRRAAEQAGVSPRAALGTLVYALRGRPLPDLQLGDETIEVLARFEQGAPLSVEDLKELRVFNRKGVEVPLGAFARFESARGLGRIRREDGKTLVTVRATSEGNDLSTLESALWERLAGLELPEGYQWRPSGRFDRMRENMESFQFAVLLAVTFVFLLMGVLFESVVLPFAVLVTIPFGFFGVYAMLVATGTALGGMSLIGIIILVGIVVNNGVVLVDRINRLRMSGLDRREALLEAGRNRLRPILMTALTTIVGLVPMAIGASGMGGISYHPLARTVIGGLAASTFFTLFLVPMAYTLFDDLGILARRLLRRALGRSS